MYLKKTVALLICITTLFPFLQSKEKHVNREPVTLADLETSIKQVMKNHNVPAAGIAMISPDGTEWVKAFGKADVENNINATPETIFRMGSVSKLVTSLAVLKLVEEGKLSLKDKIKDLVPDLKFHNPWKNNHPILVEHLLEHTTGWCTWKFAEYANNDPKPLTIKEALDMYPDSRTSKWIPGTRHHYSNSGHTVAAYIIEKITGLSFEDFVDRNLFRPMKADSMTFLQSDKYKMYGAQLYENGKRSGYYHVCMRPPAALNASVNDMKQLIKFFINRGTISKKRIITSLSLDRMEQSVTLPTSDSGMLLYGLGNAPSPYKKFIYRSHGGSVPGANSEFGYLPEHKAGYAAMITIKNPEAINEIVRLIRFFQTQNLKPHLPEHKRTEYKADMDISGYYTTLIPKLEFYTPLSRLKGVRKIWHKDGRYFKSDLFKKHISEYVPEKNGLFRSLKTGRIELAVVKDQLEGRIIHQREHTLYKVSSLSLYTYLTLLMLWLTVLIFTPFTALIRAIIFLFTKKRNRTALLINTLPLVTSIFIYIFILPFVFLTGTNSDFLRLMGTVNTGSILFMISSFCFLIFSVWSLYYIFKNRTTEMSRIFYWHSALSTVIHFTVAIIMLINGYIGIQVWNW